MDEMFFALIAVCEQGKMRLLQILMCGSMTRFWRHVILGLMIAAALVAGGCMSCLPQYVAPPSGPVSTCYPTGHDPYIPMDHNPSAFNPWDLMSSLASPFLYGPPR
ncbi:MAG: hypothetical protein WBG50_28465 [Desulfomonilaceae bacterium]